MSCTQTAFDEGGLVPDDACRTTDAPMTKHASVIASRAVALLGCRASFTPPFFQHIISQTTLNQITSSLSHRT